MFRRTPRWSKEEQSWIDSEKFPPVVVRSYRKEKRVKRDANRLKRLGYVITYRIRDWPGSGDWFVTYKLQGPGPARDRRSR